MYIEELPSGKYKCVERYLDPFTGKTKRATHTIDNKSRAQIKLAKEIIENKIDEALSLTKKRDYTLSEITDRYMEYQERNCKISSVSTTRALCNTFKRVFCDDVLLCNLTTTYIYKCLDENIEKSSSKNRIILHFKSLARWAIAEGLIEEAQWINRIRLYRTESIKKDISNKYMEKEELNKLISHIDDEQYRFIIQFLALSGLRIGELIPLTYDDVDLTNRTIQINKTFNPEGKIILDPKTYTSARTIHIQTELHKLLKEIIKFSKERQVVFGYRSSLLFPRVDGGYLIYQTLNTHFKKYTSQILEHELTLHSLRHTHASLMFENGMTLEAISERLGHKGSNITKEVYLHITNKKKAEYNNQMDKIQIL